jgi:hypothetical protein
LPAPRPTPPSSSSWSKSWPELHALVQSLQAQDLFPGLRGLSATLSGPPDVLAQGLAAILPQNAPQAR